MRIARDSFALLKASGRGSLINISSIMAHRALRQLAAYSATKGAVTALTKALAVEYAPYNIRVNALAPGFVETALTDRILRNSLIRKALIDQTPLRRFGTGEEPIHGAAIGFRVGRVVQVVLVVWRVFGVFNHEVFEGRAVHRRVEFAGHEQRRVADCRLAANDRA